MGFWNTLVSFSKHSRGAELCAEDGRLVEHTFVLYFHSLGMFNCVWLQTFILRSCKPHFVCVLIIWKTKEKRIYEKWTNDEVKVQREFKWVTQNDRTISNKLAWLNVGQFLSPLPQNILSLTLDTFSRTLRCSGNANQRLPELCSCSGKTIPKKLVKKLATLSTVLYLYRQNEGKSMFGKKRRQKTGLTLFLLSVEL